MLETSQLVGEMCLKGEWELRKERQETENRVRRTSSEYCIGQNLFLITLYSPQKGEGKDFHTTIQGTKECNYFPNS